MIGHDAGKSLTTGKYNLFVGYKSGQTATTARNNTYIGYQSAFNDIAGTNNVFLGTSSGYSNVGGKVMNLPVGVENTFIGSSSGYSNTQGAFNTFIGHQAGYLNVGTFNAMYEAYTGSWNVFIGDQTGYNNTTASNNLYAGMQAGYSSTTGGNNVFLGSSSGRDNTTGKWNVFVGAGSGWQNGDGGGNVYLGYNAGQHNNGGSNNIFIGNDAGSYVTGSSKFVLDNTNSNESTAYMYGELYYATATGRYLRLNEKLGINITPTHMVHSIDNSATSDVAAVYGEHAVTDFYGIGVEGSGKYRGMYGHATTASGSCTGVYGYATGTGTATAYGIYGAASSTGTAYAGYFSGNVHVNGTLSKNAGTFKIDHPMDPENKYLIHSFVESPDMKNIYDGVVVLDAEGKAIVTLPDYFSVLNKDFRYQLTSIGAFAPVFIEREITNNQFVIAGGTPGQKISWMVTGIRQDPYATAHPIIVEQEKNINEKGKYLNPELYNKGEEKSMMEPENK